MVGNFKFDGLRYWLLELFVDEMFSRRNCEMKRPAEALAKRLDCGDWLTFGGLSDCTD
jgi:hypothetical protein